MATSRHQTCLSVYSKSYWESTESLGVKWSMFCIELRSMQGGESSLQDGQAGGSGRRIDQQHGSACPSRLFPSSWVSGALQSREDGMYCLLFLARRSF